MSRLPFSEFDPRTWDELPEGYDWFPVHYPNQGNSENPCASRYYNADGSPVTNEQMTEDHPHYEEWLGECHLYSPDGNNVTELYNDFHNANREPAPMRGDEVLPE